MEVPPPHDCSEHYRDASGTVNCVTGNVDNVSHSPAELLQPLREHGVASGGEGSLSECA